MNVNFGDANFITKVVKLLLDIIICNYYNHFSEGDNIFNNLPEIVENCILANDCYGRADDDYFMFAKKKAGRNELLPHRRSHTLRLNDCNRTHLWRDRQGAEGASSLYKGIISQAKGQSIAITVLQ